MPLISVIVPCYNQAQYLDECLQSVLDQTYTDWECIIVNDGSPDHTEEIAKKWVEKDTRFIYLSKENGGLSDARNVGIQASSGSYIALVDSDDLIAQSFIEELYEVKQQNNIIKISNDFSKGKYEILYGFIFKDELTKKYPTFNFKRCILTK